jgi:hypothetical protein
MIRSPRYIVRQGLDELFSPGCLTQFIARALNHSIPLQWASDLQGWCAEREQEYRYLFDKPGEHMISYAGWDMKSKFFRCGASVVTTIPREGKKKNSIVAKINHASLPTRSLLSDSIGAKQLTIIFVGLDGFASTFK